MEILTTAEKTGRLRIYCDGACAPYNPNGVATYAFIVYEGEERKDRIRIHEEAGVVAEGKGATNNLAEFAAVCAALRWVLQEGWVNSKITIFSDSRLVVNIMNKEWQPQDETAGYYPAYREANELLEQVVALGNKVIFHWHSRVYNAEANLLANTLAYKTYIQQNPKRARYFKLKKPTTCCVCDNLMPIGEDVVGIPFSEEWKIFCAEHINHNNEHEGDGE